MVQNFKDVRDFIKIYGEKVYLQYAQFFSDHICGLDLKDGSDCVYICSEFQGDKKYNLATLVSLGYENDKPIDFTIDLIMVSDEGVTDEMLDIYNQLRK